MHLQNEAIARARQPGEVRLPEPARQGRDEQRRGREAQADGFNELKFFPAVQSGGLALLKAWSSPFLDVRFCPTGGIHPGNAAEFLALPNVACVGGSWVAPAEAVRAGDWARITGLAREAAALARL